MVMFCLESHLLLFISQFDKTITHLLGLPVRKQVSVCFYAQVEALIAFDHEHWSLQLQESSFVLWLHGWLEIKLC